jgi:Rrf2 family protein
VYITSEADYAVRIVNTICTIKKRADAGTISALSGVSLRFSLKILRKLASSGIVKSFKGSKGGYELAANPSDITLKQVIECVDGTYYLSRCLSSEYECNHIDKSCCPTYGVFEEISSIIRKKLEEITFDKLSAK